MTTFLSLRMRSSVIRDGVSIIVILDINIFYVHKVLFKQLSPISEKRDWGYFNSQIFF
jgi:hypothetical protein